MATHPPSQPLSRDESSRDMRPHMWWPVGRILIIPTYKSSRMDSAFSRSREIPCLYARSKE